MLEPEMVANFHDYGKPDQEILGANPDFINLRPSSWNKREFSSDEDSHHSLMTSLLNTPMTSPSTSTMQDSQTNLSTIVEIKSEDLSPSLIDMKISSLITSPNDDVNNFQHTRNEMRMCNGCNLLIKGGRVNVISERLYHEECCRCSACGKSFTSSCFVRRGKLFCVDDYNRVKRICHGCDEEVAIGTMMIRMSQTCSVFHLTCFKCAHCGLLLKTGDKFTESYLGQISCHQCMKDSGAIMTETNVTPEQHDVTETSLMTSKEEDVIKIEPDTTLAMTACSSKANSTASSNCHVIDLITSPRSHSSIGSPKSDDDVGEISDDDDKDVTSPNESTSNIDDGNEKDDLEKDDGESGDKRPKRPRTILNAAQRAAFREAFDMSPKPCRKVREALASKTGLTARVVQVWFQNQRAKVKKLAKRQLSRDQKAREQFGFHGYEQMTSLPHHPMFTPQEPMMDPPYGHYPPRPHDVAIWERMHSGPPPPSPYGYPDNVTLPLHDHMTPSADEFSPSRFSDCSSFPCHTIAREAAVDQAFIANQYTPMRNAHVHHPMGNEPMGTPINGLYSMQNNYFSS